MNTGWPRRQVLRQGSLITSIGLSGCLGELTGPSPEAQVRDHEEALSRFTDVATAIQEGYRTLGIYIKTDQGVLGIPFLNQEIEELHPEKPQIVLYTLTENGQYEPLGLKWFVLAEGRETTPSLFGKQFEGPQSGEAGFLPNHYRLTVWLFRENPSGLFATYHPTLKPPELVDRIKPIRERLSKLAIGSKAEEQGYKNTEKCVQTDDGGYGIPFIKETADGSGGMDPMDPPILIYRVTSNWSYELLGAEWFVPTTDTDTPPTLFDQAFHDPLDGHSPKIDQSEHYGLHAWFFRANPRGMFEPFNPTITC